MSSGFVPAGSDAATIKQDDAWVKAQQLVAQSRSVEARPSKSDDGKTLYDVLQQNKAAKQEAYEEAARLKNQFRSLDDDEVDFLDSVLESTRAKEAAVRKETAEQLEVFRKQREVAEKAQLEDDKAAAAKTNGAGSPTAQDTWAPRLKKRRRDKESVPALGAKLRKMSSTDGEKPAPATVAKTDTADPSKTASAITTATEREFDAESLGNSEVPDARQKSPHAAALGLGDYGSDED